MKRYKVVLRNAKECRIELNFPDLQVKFSNGYSLPLKVKEGEEIPFDLLDVEDIKKSWIIGSLKGYLENKWLEEIPAIIKTDLEVEKRNTNFVSEQDIRLISKEEVLPQTNLPEIEKVIDKLASVPQSEPIIDLEKVFSYEDFNKLSHFLKLRFIKESSDINLLRKIQSLTTSSQFKNNVTLRLSQISV